MTTLTVNDIRPRVRFLQTVGGTTSFDLPFQILAGADVKVAIDDGPENAVAFTLQMLDETGAARLHFAEAPPLGAVVTVWRDMPIQRTASFRDDGSFRAAALNLQLNALTLSVQQVEALAGDAVRRAVSDTDIDLTLPRAERRAGRYLSFDDAGRPMAEIPVAPIERRYLGAHASAPPTRNDGTPLQPGDLYFDTTADRMKVRAVGGSAWVAVALEPASFLSREGTSGIPMEGDIDLGGHRIVNGVGPVPAGTVILHASSVPPAGYLKCNGAAVGRAAYAALFGVINTFWGAGDGSTTFNVPDLRGEFPRFWDDGRGVDSGRTFGSHQLDALQNFSGWIRSVWTGGGTITGAFTGYPSSTNNKPGTGGGYTFDIAFSPGPGGARVATETRPRNVALMACIKY